MRRASIAPVLALAATLPAFVANAWYLVIGVLAIGRPHPFAGDFGLVWFAAGAAMWSTDAVFGFVALRLRVVTPWGALALAIGSVLAITGMDRLGLTSPASPTTFESLALSGVALNGIGWILLGIDLVGRRRVSEAQAQPARS